MEVIRDSDFYIERGTAVCIGKFDGVHLGHRKLIHKLVSQKQRGLLATIFTFDPSPEELFSGVKSGQLCTRYEKEEFLDEMGVDIVIEFPLTLVSAAMPPEDFVRNILLGRLNMQYIIAGEDLSFGAQGKGDRTLMERLALEHGFDCEIIEKIKHEGEEISSSRIRQAIEDGRVDQAYRMLGRTN